MGALTAPHTIALSILALYFLLIILLLFVIFSSIRSHANIQNHPKSAVLFCGLTLTSFVHTWYWMFRFIIWSFRDFEGRRAQQGTQDNVFLQRVSMWLMKTSLFEQAWSTVCMGPLNWWWSEQLCLFTAGGFTVFLFTQRGRVPYIWAYMLLGQMVAISVAWSLLNVALVLIPPPKTASNNGKTHLSVTLTVPVVLSLLTVSLSPYTTPTTFLPNLLVMHTLLILPLLPLPSVTPPCLSPRSSSFYTLISLVAILLRIRTTLAVLSFLHVTSSPLFSLQYPVDVLVALWNAPGVMYGAVWDILHSHPAQASIGWDVVWTSVTWVAWGVFGDRAAGGSVWTVSVAATKVFPTVVASIGVVAPIDFSRVLRNAEGQDKTE